MDYQIDAIIITIVLSTSPNSYQCRQRNNNYNHITFPNTQNIQHNNINNYIIQQHKQTHGYHNNNTVASGVTYQLNSLTQNTSLYSSNLQHMGSQTPAPAPNESIMK
eukprot:95944_1